MKWKEKPKEIVEVIPEFVSGDYFATQSLKRAVWQYLIDHAQIAGDTGNLFFKFYIPNSESEFWRRVNARDTGKYSRVDLVDFQDKMRKEYTRIIVMKQELEELKKAKIMNAVWEKRIHTKEKNGTFKQKLLLKLAKLFRVLGRSLTNKVLTK